MAKNGEFQQLKDLFKQIKDLLADQPNVNQGQFIKDLLNKLKEEGSEDLPINKILEFFKNNDINLEDLKNEFTFEDPKEENILDTILNYIKENTAENENPITDLEDDGVLQTAITNAVIQNVKNKAENSQNNLGTEIIPDKTTKQNNTSLFTPEETKDSEKQPLFEKEVNVSIKNNANANIQPIKDNVLNLKTNQDASQANVNANNNTLDKVIDTAIQNAQTVKPEAAADKAAQTQSLNSTPQKSDTTLQNLESKLNQVEEKAPQADKVKNTPMASYLSKAFNAEREIIDRIVTQANMRLNGANKEINFNLTPPELGKVRVSITDIEGVISGKIQVENDVIKEIVQSNLAQLRTSLTQSIKIDKLEVEVRDSTADLKQQGSAWNKGESDAGAKENNQSSEHNRYYSNNTEEVFGIKIPAPKGVNIKSDGLVTVDLIG
ncbi:MAG: flagellar hook-length control protein [uncultured bacterium]|nr:MAG: flagellar hook-length control protein [uncultured bacterium]